MFMDSKYYQWFVKKINFKAWLQIRRNILLNLLLEKGAIKGITSDSGMDLIIVIHLLHKILVLRWRSSCKHPCEMSFSIEYFIPIYKEKQSWGHFERLLRPGWSQLAEESDPSVWCTCQDPNLSLVSFSVLHDIFVKFHKILKVIKLEITHLKLKMTQQKS